MKNIINEKPGVDLNGRLGYTVNFVRTEDIKRKEVLDIGCGYGWCELFFLNEGVKSIVASEITSSDLGTIKANIKDKRVKFKIASAIRLPFPNRTFDTVVAWEVLEHIPKGTENLMFSEVYRVLKPNGVFYLSTPYKSLVSVVFDPAWWLIGHRHYSKGDIFKFCKGTGFKVRRISIKGGIWEAIGLLNFYFSKWLLRRKPLLSNLFADHINKEYKSEGCIGLFAHLVRE